MGAHRRLVSTLAKVVGYWHNVWQAQVQSWKEAKFYNQLLSLTIKNSTWAWCLPTKLCKSWHPSIMLMKINTPQKPNIPQGWLLTLKELEKIWTTRIWTNQQCPKPVPLRFKIFPFTTWPWKDILTGRIPESQRKGIYNPRMCQGDSSRTSMDCLRVNSFEKVKRKLSKCRVDFLKEVKSLLLTQSFAMLLSAHQVRVQIVCLAGPIFPWSVEGAVKHILF